MTMEFYRDVFYINTFPLWLFKRDIKYKYSTTIAKANYLLNQYMRWYSIFIAHLEAIILISIFHLEEKPFIIAQYSVFKKAWITETLKWANETLWTLLWNISSYYTNGFKRTFMKFLRSLSTRNSIFVCTQFINDLIWIIFKNRYIFRSFIVKY